MKIVTNTSDEPTDSSFAVVSNTTLGLLAQLTSDLDVRTGEIANPLRGHLGALAELTFPQVTATSAGQLLLLKTTNETKIDRQTMVETL
ncbi:MAG TPA: hypothetical protein VIH75_22645 [Candidatus Sulfotelmatobacter sp.]